MEIGGAERALLGLLESIDTTKYQVDLFLLRHEGELMKYIPENINLLPENSSYAAMQGSIVAAIKNCQFRVGIGRLIAKIRTALSVKKFGYSDSSAVAIEYSHKYTYKVMPQMSDDAYDIAISFLTPHYYVANKVNARKKSAWIHTDYATMQIDRNSELKMWRCYDTIVSISKSVTDNFLKTFPELREKITEIGNILPRKSMARQAAEKIIEPQFEACDSIRLLSIGRFCQAKNFDNVPVICKKLRDEGLDIVWFLIGFGIDEELIFDKIKEQRMEKYVVVLGKKENPYPYIANCDLYVQPSRYEGKCVSVIEAQTLNKPVVITNYSTASSQLEDGKDGVIVPLSVDECARELAKVIRDKSIQQKLIQNTKNRDYSNSTEINKVYQLL